MSAILKVRLPYYARTISTGTNGVAEFFFLEKPKYVPALNQQVVITHTEVSSNSGLNTKLTNISTNTVIGKFQAAPDLTNQPEAVAANGGYSYLFSLSYDDSEFSQPQFGGTCRGYIEYDYNPTNYEILKPVESVVVVNETVPFDLNDGYQKLAHEYQDPNLNTTDVLPGFFVGRQDNNTIFANLLKSLNLPVTDEEYKKYSRSAYGVLDVATSTDVVAVKQNGINYKWTEITSSYTGTTDALVTHPTTGYTGEHYGTVMQTLGCNEFETNKPWNLPVPNDMFLVLEIPNNKYGEIIDGKTIKLTLPYYNGVDSLDADEKRLGVKDYTSATNSLIEIYSTYSEAHINNNLDKKLSDSSISVSSVGVRPDIGSTTENTYESNVALLFSDTIAPPSVNFNNWGDGYTEVINGTKVFTPNGQEKPTYNYKNDKAVGVAYLDKGFIVITHPTIVDSYFKKVFLGDIVTAGSTNVYKNYDLINGFTGSTRGDVRTTTTGDTKQLIVTKDGSNVVWDSTQFIYTDTLVSTVEYNSYNTEKSLNIVCLASSDEFFKTSNDTAKDLQGVEQIEDYASFKTTDGDLYPVIVTQLGIHDADGNLLAICKPTQPIKKYWYDVVSFNVKIRL